MTGGRLPWLEGLLPASRRERALAAKLADTRASLADVAETLRALSALENAWAHQTIKAVRRGSNHAGESIARDPAASALQGTITMPASVALTRARKMAGALDQATEALERLAASLREG